MASSDCSINQPATGVLIKIFEALSVHRAADRLPSLLQLLLVKRNKEIKADAAIGMCASGKEKAGQE